MPFDDNNWSTKKMVSYVEMKARLQEAGVCLVPIASTDKSDTTKWFRIHDYQGRIGFISSMTRWDETSIIHITNGDSNFCGGCNRLRVTTEGRLKVCLFGSEAWSLRDAFRSTLTVTLIYSCKMPSSWVIWRSDHRSYLQRGNFKESCSGRPFLSRRTCLSEKPSHDPHRWLKTENSEISTMLAYDDNNEMKWECRFQTDLFWLCSEPQSLRYSLWVRCVVKRGLDDKRTS